MATRSLNLTREQTNAQASKLRDQRLFVYPGGIELGRKQMTKLSFRMAAVLGVAFLGFASSPLHAETVNCDSVGKDLQKAIDNAAPNSEIFISGTCDTGSFLINKDLKLIGPATLSGGSTVLHVLGHNVEITNVNIDADGSDNGLLTTGATVRLNHVVIEGAASTGARIDQSSAAEIFGESVFSDNGVFGLAISGSSGVNLRNATIENNANVGILVEMSSHANTANNTINENGTGISVNSNASIFLVDSTITNSLFSGVFATLQGYVQGAGSPSTFGNNGVDVRCNDRGILAFSSGPQLPLTGSTADDGTCIITGPIF